MSQSDSVKSILPEKVNLFSDDLLFEDRELRLEKRFSDFRLNFGNVKLLKIFFTLVSLFGDSQVFEQHKFSISALCEYLNMKYDKSSRELRKTLEKFKDAEILFPKEDGENEEDRGALRILSICKISDTKQFVNLKLNSDLVDIFLFDRSKGFIQSVMNAIIDITYADSLLFYLILKKNYWVESNGNIKKNSFELTVTEFRSLCQVKEDSYANEGNVRRNILNRIQKDINENSDLIFSYELIRGNTRGKPIRGYRFLIEKNHNFTDAKKRLKPLSKTIVGLEKLKEDIIAARKRGFKEVFDYLEAEGYGEIGLGEISRSKLQPSDISKIIKLTQKDDSIINPMGYIRRSIQNKIDIIAATELADKEVAAMKESMSVAEKEEKEEEKNHSIKVLQYIREAILPLPEKELDSFLLNLNKTITISKVSKEDLVKLNDPTETAESIINFPKFQIIKRYIDVEKMMQ